MEVWIKVYHDLSEHPKVYRLAETLKVEQYAAVGLVVSLWTWALTHAPDGDLEKFPDAALARACYWKKSPSAFVQALTAAGWLDEPKHLHDWDEYTGALMDATKAKKEKARQRAEAYRERRKASVTPALQSVTSSGDGDERHARVTCDDSVTDALRNADVTESNALRTRTRTRTITRTDHSSCSGETENNRTSMDRRRESTEQVHKPPAQEGPAAFLYHGGQQTAAGL